MKKFLSLLMAAVMVFALVACGGNNAANNGTADNGGSNSADAGDTGSTSGAVTIRVGGIGPLTGAPPSTAPVANSVRSPWTRSTPWAGTSSLNC